MTIDFIILLKNLHIDKKIQFDNVEIDNFKGFSLSDYDRYINEFLSEKLKISSRADEAWDKFINIDAKEQIPGAYIKISETIEDAELSNDLFFSLCKKYSIQLLVGMLSVEYKNAAIPVVALIIDRDGDKTLKSILNYAYKGFETKTVLKGKCGLTHEAWCKIFLENISKIKPDNKLILILGMYSEMQNEMNTYFKFFRAWNILETLAWSKKKGDKIDKVRNFAKEIGIGIIPINVKGYIDIYHYIYKVRNDIVHEGKAERDVSDYPSVNCLVTDCVSRYISKKYYL